MLTNIQLRLRETALVLQVFSQKPKCWTHEDTDLKAALEETENQRDNKTSVKVREDDEFSRALKQRPHGRV